MSLQAIELPSRRSFLLSAAVMPSILLGTSASAQTQFQPQDFWGRPRTIWMKRAETKEEIKAVYWADGELVRSEYLKLCWFMRDVKMEKLLQRNAAQGRVSPASWHAAVAMSPVLLDILYATGGWLDYYGIPRPLEFLSGFRHEYTNARTEGAALLSRHIGGGAGDIHIPGVRAANVSAFGRWLSGGGVGWYPNNSFTHVDDGKLRFWKG